MGLFRKSRVARVGFTTSGPALCCAPSVQLGKTKAMFRLLPFIMTYSKNCRFSAVFLPDRVPQSDGFPKQIHWFRSAISMDLLNDSNDIVQRFHWNCFARLPFFLLHSVNFVVYNWQFRVEPPVFWQERLVVLHWFFLFLAFTLSPSVPYRKGMLSRFPLYAQWCWPATAKRLKRHPAHMEDGGKWGLKGSTEGRLEHFSGT